MGAMDGVGVCGVNVNPSIPVIQKKQECFEWNKQMWKGVARKEDPVYTICGLERCIKCDHDVACYDWNRHLYVGDKPSNPLATECGLEECTDCPYNRYMWQD